MKAPEIVGDLVDNQKELSLIRFGSVPLAKWVFIIPHTGLVVQLLLKMGDGANV